MDVILGTFFGVLIALAICWQRMRDLKQARDAAFKQNAMLWRQNARLLQSNLRHRGMLEHVFATARALKRILGGTVTPPATAGMNVGRQMDAFSKLANFTGPSSDWRPRFLGKG